MRNQNLIYDIGKISDFVFGDPSERNSDVEITEKFEYDNGVMVPKGKTVKEVKASDYTGQNTIRYDLIKMFMSILDEVSDDNLMTVGEEITFNTMKAYQFIRDINDGEEEDDE